MFRKLVHVSCLIKNNTRILIQNFKIMKKKMIIAFLCGTALLMGISIIAADKCSLEMTCDDGAEISCSTTNGNCTYLADDPPDQNGYVTCGTQTVYCQPPPA